MQIPFIQKANNMGLHTIVADLDANAPGMKYGKDAVAISTMDKEGILNCGKTHAIDGIFTTSDAPVNVVSYVSEQLGLSSMTTDVARICTNKYLQREIFAANGINVPFFKLCDSSTNLSLLTDFPYIVKPVDSSASRGVRKVSNLEELKAAFDDALNYSRNKNVIIESFITGREFSVETYTQNNVTTIVTATEKLCIGETEGFFVEDTHIEPARISDKEYLSIETEVKKAFDVIGINNCPTHTEIKINEKGAFIIEIACRLGGDYITSDLVPLSTGVDMLENLIKVSLGEVIDAERKFNKCSSVQFLNPKNYERCVEFISSGDSHIIRHEVKEFSNNQIKSSLDRLGFIILQADSMKEIEEIINKIK
jgi:biotin carboxylase